MKLERVGFVYSESRPLQKLTGAYEQLHRVTLGGVSSVISFLVFPLSSVRFPRLVDDVACYQVFTVRSPWPLDEMLGLEGVEVDARCLNQRGTIHMLTQHRCQCYCILGELIEEKPLLMRRIMQRGQFTGSASAFMVRLIRASFNEAETDHILRRVWLNGDELLREALPEMSEQLAEEEKGRLFGQDLLDCFRGI